MASIIAFLASASLILSVASATYQYPSYQYPSYVYPRYSSPYRGLRRCYTIPPYQIPVDEPSSGPGQQEPSAEPGSRSPSPSYAVPLGPPDSMGLRIPLADPSLPANATSLDADTLRQLFTDLESENTSTTEPQSLSEPAGCPVFDGSFTSSLPSVPGASPTTDTAFYLFCYTNCFPRFQWKALPSGFFPPFIRLATCPRRNCSIPSGQTCQIQSQRFITVLKLHCCETIRYEQVPNPTQAEPVQQRVGKSGNYYLRNAPQPPFRLVVRPVLRCGYYRVRIPTVSTCRCACPQRYGR